MINWKKTFSISKIKLYEDCPYRYKKQYITWEIPFKRTPQICLGQTMADVIEEIYTNPAKYKNIQKDEIIALFYRYWIPKQQKKHYNIAFTKTKTGMIHEPTFSFLGYASPAEELKSKASGLSLLFKYIDKHPIMRIFAIEKEFFIDIEDFTINGRIDRIDYVDHGLRVIDNKVSSWVNRDLVTDLQLNVYAFVCEQLFPEFEVKSVGLYYLPLEEYSIIERASLVTDKTINRLKKSIHAIWDGHFNPTKNRWCPTCPVNDCPLRK